MTNLKQNWTKSDIDAISIRGSSCKLDIQGTDEDLIALEGDYDERYWRDLEIGLSERWLKIHSSKRNNSPTILKLPKSKAWVINIYSGQADVKILDIQSRLQIMTGRGDIQVKDYRGQLLICTQNASIRVKDYIQSDIPEPPPSAQKSAPEASEKSSSPDWLHWDETQWETWGEDLGEKISKWAMGIGNYFDHGEIIESNPNINLRTEHGNIEIEHITTKSGIFKVSHGNIKLDDGTIGHLGVNISHGNLDSKSIIPGGNWTIKANHGNIRLSLPANVEARLDMATRNGSLNSEIPLVRVTRQGPESVSGRRMVGNIGQSTEPSLPEIRLTTNNGNIEIKSQAPVTQYSAQPVAAAGSSQPEEHQEANPILLLPEAVATDAVAVAVKDAPQDDFKPTGDDTILTILAALKNGRINTDEADQLLRSLEL